MQFDFTINKYTFLDPNIADVIKNGDNSVSISCGTNVDKNCLVSYYSASTVLNRILSPGQVHTITVEPRITLFEIDTFKNSTQYLWRFVCEGTTQ